MYADYEFYAAEYFGITIPSEASYKYYGSRAAEYIEQATFGRATADNVRVKKCECRVAELLYANNDSGNADDREVKSESLGGWSRTYAESKRSDSDLEAKIQTTIRQYLALTGMLYRGQREWKQ